MVEQILTALFQQGKIFLRIFLRKRSAGLDLRAAPVHFQSADRGHNDRNMRLKA